MEPAKTLRMYLESGGTRWPNAFVQRLAGYDAISDLFTFTIDLWSPDDQELASLAYPGASVTLVLERDGLDLRRIHGLVKTVADRLDDSAKHRSYQLTVVPHAFLLSLVQTQEVYLDLSIPEVLKQKLSMHLESDSFEFRLLESYPQRELIVQYGESDLDFIRRLAEHVGISFFFEDGATTDKWVFTDHPAGFGVIEELESVHYHARGEALGVFALGLTSELVPGTFFVQDYNYRTPLLEPTGEYTADEEAPGGIVEYGTHVKSPDEAKWMATIRGQEVLSRKVVYEGKSSVVELSSGKVTELVDHPRLEGSRRLLVLRVEHTATFPSFEDGNVSEAAYLSAFRAIPAEVVYRPARRTPRPRLPGVVTAIIQTGPGGEVGGVAQLTEDGRYTVQLHFDTAPRGQQKASNPVRMAQPFAGHGNGMHFPLLPGTEVLIAFANGDPDRPVIVGALPNPISPAAVVAEEAHTHRIQTSQGVTIQFGQTVPGRR